MSLSEARYGRWLNRQAVCWSMIAGPLAYLAIDVLAGPRGGAGGVIPAIVRAWRVHEGRQEEFKAA